MIEQGATFSNNILLTDANNNPINLTGYSANASLKRYYGYANVWNFSTSINGNNGIIVISMTANQTSNIMSGRYVWDCKIIDTANNVTRVVEGYINVTPEVS